MQIVSTLVIFIFVIILITYLINRNKEIRGIILIALFIRFVAAIYHNYLDPLPILGYFPDSGNDEFYFAERAIYFFNESYNLFDITGVDFYPFIISLTYIIFGQNDFLIPLLNIIFNLFTLVFVFKISQNFIDKKSAKYAALLFALIPMQIVYSSIGIREAFFTFSFTGFIFYFMSWYFKKSKKKSLILSLIFFIITAIIHDGIIFILIPIVFMILFYRANRINFASKLFFIIFLISFIFSGLLNYTTGDFFRSEDKLVYFEEIRAKLLEKDRTFTYATQNFNPLNLFYNFTFRPYIYEYNAGLFRIPNTIIIYYFFFWMFKHRRTIKNDLRLKFLLVIIFSSLISYSLGSGDLFQSDRHRSKFIPLIVVLISFSPRIKKIYA